MTKKEISRRISAINSLKDKRKSSDVVIYDEINSFIKQLIKENGEEETRDIREELLVNIINHYLKKNQKMSFAPYSNYVVEAALIQEQKGKLQEAKENLELALDGSEDKFSQFLSSAMTTDDVKKVLKTSRLALVTYRYNTIKYKLGEQSFAETLEKLNEINEDSKQNQEALGRRFTAFELFKLECADLVDFKYLEEEIFPGLDDLERGEGSDQIHGEVKYTEDLLPSNRLKFIKENFKVASAYMGKSGFDGYLLFELEDTDLMIAERFWDIDKKGKISVATESATYILPKDDCPELIKKSRMEITRLSKQDPRIQKANHYSKPEDRNFSSTYYTNLKKKFNTAVGYEYFKDTKRKAKTPVIKKSKSKYSGSLNARETTKKLSDEIDGNTSQEEPKNEEEKVKTIDEMSREELQEFISQLSKELIAVSNKLIEATKLKEQTRELVEQVTELNKKLQEADKALSER